LFAALWKYVAVLKFRLFITAHITMVFRWSHSIYRQNRSISTPYTAIVQDKRNCTVQRYGIFFKRVISSYTGDRRHSFRI